MMFCREKKRTAAAAWLLLPVVFVFVFFVLATLPAVPRGEAAVLGADAAEQEQPSSLSGGGGGGERRRRRRELRGLGSRPPCCDCERRCGDCAPCTAVQVRAGAAAWPQCAASNYEPVGWKCKCGSAIFDP